MSSERLPRWQLWGRCVVVGALFVALFQDGIGCGGGEDLTCGSGTRQKGDKCVVNTGGTDGGAGTDSGDASIGLAFAGVKAVAPASATSLLVVWDAATDAATPQAEIQYAVYVADASGGQSYDAATVLSAPGATSTVVTGLTTDTEYFVVVRARVADGVEDQNTVEKSGTPSADGEAPTFAGVVSATPKGGGSVELAWDAASDNLTPTDAIVYFAYVSETAGTATTEIPVAASAPGATSVTVEGLSPDKPYFFAVRASDAAGNRDANTKEISATTGKDTTAPVSGGGCWFGHTISASTIHVGWHAATDETTPAAQLEYRVYAATSSGAQDFENPSGVFKDGVLHGEVTGLIGNTTKYWFVCRAVDASGNEDQNTVEVSATTDDDSTPPTFNGITAAETPGCTSVMVKWAAGSEDKSSPITYEVYAATAPGGHDFNQPPVASVDEPATSVKVTGLSSSTKYYFVVRACDKGGNCSANKEEKTATTLISFANDIQKPILAVSCAVLNCHSGANPTGSMRLTVQACASEIVGAASIETASPGCTAIDGVTFYTPLNRVEPFKPDESYLMKKILGQQCTLTERMPPPPAPALPQNEIDAIKNWILEGAKCACPD